MQKYFAQLTLKNQGPNSQQFVNQTYENIQKIIRLMKILINKNVTIRKSYEKRMHNYCEITKNLAMS